LTVGFERKLQIGCVGIDQGRAGGHQPETAYQVLLIVCGQLGVGGVKGEDIVGMWLQCRQGVAIIEEDLREAEMVAGGLQKGLDEVSRERPGGEDAGLLSKRRLIKIFYPVFAAPGQGHDGFVVAEDQGVPLLCGHVVEVEMEAVEEGVGGAGDAGIPSGGVDLVAGDVADMVARAGGGVGVRGWLRRAAGMAGMFASTHLPTMSFRKSMFWISIANEIFFPRLFWSETVLSWLEKSLL